MKFYNPEENRQYYKPGALGLKVVVWLAKNLDECLMTSDILVKFGGNPASINQALMPFVRDGWLETTYSSTPGRAKIYSPGPKLKEL